MLMETDQLNSTGCRSTSCSVLMQGQHKRHLAAAIEDKHQPQDRVQEGHVVVCSSLGQQGLGCQRLTACQACCTGWPEAHLRSCLGLKPPTVALSQHCCMSV